MNTVLTIAGSDSSGGAGIQADLKVISLLGGYGMSVITALTAQNTQGVLQVHAIPAEFVERQFEAVCSDIQVDAAKTGMLYSEGIIEVVAKNVKKYDIAKLVIDPVMVAKDGSSLLFPKAHESFIKDLIPLCFVITPNLHEASILTGIEVNGISEMEQSARKLFQMGAQNVLIKGGHLQDKAIDVLFDGLKFYHLYAPRIQTKNTHGTGCVYSAAITTNLARELPLYNSVDSAKRFVTKAILNGLDIGSGHGPTNPYANFEDELERCKVLEELKSQLERLRRAQIGELIPEVQSNLALALPHALDHSDIAAFPGRIVKYKTTIATVAPPEFGVSKHIANIILTLMKFDRNYRAAMNIKYSCENLRKCQSFGFIMGNFDRTREPKDVKDKEGASLEWGVAEAIKSTGCIPDVIYDLGDIGKEPVMRIIGKNAVEVVDKVIAISS